MKHYFQARLVSKANPIKSLMSKPVLNDRLARWYPQFQQLKIIYLRQVLADFLSDHPTPAEWELSDDLPDEDVLVIEVLPPGKIYFSAR